MFNYEQSPPERQMRADWTGLITAALLSPVFFAFVYFGKAEMGFTAYIVSCAVAIAVKLRWKLRRFPWFWGAIVLVLALHIPFLFMVRWPQTNIPTIAFSLPLGLADFLLVSGAISLAAKAFSKGEASDEGDE